MNAIPPIAAPGRADHGHQHKSALVDAFGRQITYLRLSVTDRCDLRCQYCMGEDMQFMSREQLLTSDELVAIANSFIDRGISTIRLTGGEPLTRRDFPAIAAAIGQRIGCGLAELTLTTNATQLATHAVAIARAGITRINVSVDTLDPLDFRMITRGGDIAKVLTGISAAQDAGIKVRINMVAMSGFNDRCLSAMLDWCDGQGFDLALIEAMPMGSVSDIRSASHIALVPFIAKAIGDRTLHAIGHRTAGPARYVTIDGWNVRIGLITPISNNFCSACNRIRMTADGKVHGCLGHDSAIDLAAAWRRGGQDALDPLIASLMRTKAERHQFAFRKSIADTGPVRHMSVTGG